MPTLIPQPTRITAAGNKPKLIDEYIGRVNSHDSAVSVAHMRSPHGWVEPGQAPEFDEFTVVLKGLLHVKSKNGELDVRSGQARCHACGRVGAVFHAQCRRRRVYCCLPSGILHGNGASR